MTIRGFTKDDVGGFFETGAVPRRAKWASVAVVVGRKLDMLDYADTLLDLKSPPGNRLEPLRGNLQGVYSIRVNDQWRIIFRWTDGGPTDVDIVDYH